jgi:hypothetical protein
MREPGALTPNLWTDALGSSQSKMSANDCNVRASKNNKVFRAFSGSRQRCERGVRQNTTAVWRFSRGTPKYPPLDGANGQFLFRKRRRPPPFALRICICTVADQQTI